MIGWLKPSGDVQLPSKIDGAVTLLIVAVMLAEEQPPHLALMTVGAMSDGHDVSGHVNGAHSVSLPPASVALARRAR